ncbi:Transposase DDE domain protein [Corynebacterium faecale]|uniref:IS1380 family transposase n=1 Tax=Corynebacterium faecale TaxID=1758466 RepID=UPI0025B2A237|nr:IS1380 family transposase [Corynebacterium faecale]WJY91907.1 Transposase DDE domain protein [Corynebacterium faecale]WJY91910.1 Transposase DDE domain protein [Corynebacterium faecale]
MKTTTITIGAPSPRQICSNAGLLAFARTATHLAVTDTIDDALTGQQSPNLTHTVGSTMTSLALALILGADDVSDINLLDPLVSTGLITQVPSDSTIHRRHQELADLGNNARSPLTAAMKTIRTRAWNKLGPRNPATRATVDNPLVIDLDATEITAHSDKELASATWKKHFGFHPLCAFIDLGDDHGGEVLSIKLRTGKAGANTVADHLDVLDAALASLPDHADGQPWGRRLLIRSDAGGGTKGLIEHIESLGHGYLMGFRGSDAIGIIASTTGKAAKSHILRPDGAPATLATGFIADITGRIQTWAPQRPPKIGINLDNYPAGMRVIMKAEHPASGAQLTITDVDGRRVRLFVTNLTGQPQRLDRAYSRRGRCEQRIKNLKDLGLSKLPHHGFGMNQAWILSVMLAHNLIVYTGLIDSIAGHGHGHRWWGWEPKTIRARTSASPQ